MLADTDVIVGESLSLLDVSQGHLLGFDRGAASDLEFLKPDEGQDTANHDEDELETHGTASTLC